MTKRKKKLSHEYFLEKENINRFSEDKKGLLVEDKQNVLPVASDLFFIVTLCTFVQH